MIALKIIRYTAWTAITDLVASIAVYGLFGLRLEVRQSGTAVGGPFELSTIDGKPFTNADVEGKPYLVFFGLTICPDGCCSN